MTVYRNGGGPEGGGVGIDVPADIHAVRGLTPVVELGECVENLPK